MCASASTATERYESFLQVCRFFCVVRNVFQRDNDLSLVTCLMGRMSCVVLRMDFDFAAVQVNNAATVVEEAQHRSICHCQCHMDFHFLSFRCIFTNN